MRQLVLTFALLAAVVDSAWAQQNQEDAVADAVYQEADGIRDRAQNIFWGWYSGRSDSVSGVLLRQACAQERMLRADLAGNRELMRIHMDDMRASDRVLSDLETTLMRSAYEQLHDLDVLKATVVAMSAVSIFEGLQSGHLTATSHAFRSEPLAFDRMCAS